jgi:pilus assembly protein CpaE
MSADVLILTNDPAVRELATYLRAERIQAEVVNSYAEALRFLEHTPECIAVMDTELPPDIAFPIYELLHDHRPVPTLMLVQSGNYQQFALDAHRPEMDEFVTKPAKIDALVHRVKALLLHAGYDLPTAAAPGPARSGNGEIRTPVGEEFQEGRNGSIIAIFATKGGVGKSTIAVNLALGLAQTYEQKTLLVDSDLWFGDVGVQLNLASNKSLYEGYDDEGELDLSRILKVLTPHPSGAQLLLRPPDPSMAERIDANSMIRALLTYRNFFDYIIVDMHSTFNEMNLQILEIADRILLVTTPEISAIHNTARFLAIADALDYTEKSSLVLNRANSGIQLAALEQQLGMPITATIISAGRVVVEAANRGNPLILDEHAQLEEVTRNLRGIIETVAGRAWPTLGPQGRARPRSFLGNLRSLGGR